MIIVHVIINRLHIAEFKLNCPSCLQATLDHLKIIDVVIIVGFSPWKYGLN